MRHRLLQVAFEKVAVSAGQTVSVVLDAGAVNGTCAFCVYVGACAWRAARVRRVSSFVWSLLPNHSGRSRGALIPCTRRPQVRSRHGSGVGPGGHPVLAVGGQRRRRDFVPDVQYHRSHVTLCCPKDRTAGLARRRLHCVADTRGPTCHTFDSTDLITYSLPLPTADALRVEFLRQYLVQS